MGEKNGWTALIKKKINVTLRSHRADSSPGIRDKELETNEKEAIITAGSILPEITRPCSVSLDESLRFNKEERNLNKRPHCLRLVR